ncbi:phage tail assembly chaperone [Cohnella silvisoli]|uniref:XkdN-like protein n=1 Tax=Cohnella silvisoli TaxID=2873699 RepID=A0ABV1KZ45_9BACL|nr:hypothetical protein [Cohnella silvisoli]MCD9024313.1 hypothetical protein [Cohnella silvisoli]
MATKGLDALLGATLDQQSQVYIPRLKTHFSVKALTSEELRKANDQATVPTGRGERKLDNNLFNAVLVVKGCVDPDFSNKTLIQHYEATDAADCVTKALLPGEIVKLFQTVLDLSGFGDDDELIEDAKN